MKPVVTQEDKKLVGYLSKKSKKPKVHVYYNKRKADGSTNYLTGTFFSKKNQRTLTYRSSYELRFFHLLEADIDVMAYEVEAVKIPYKLGKSFKNYVPDVIVSYRDGRIKVCEIKPEAMLDNDIVKAKASACKSYFNNLLKDSTLIYEYSFITEKDLFSTPTEYATFILANSKKGKS